MIATRAICPRQREGLKNMSSPMVPLPRGQSHLPRPEGTSSCWPRIAALRIEDVMKMATPRNTGSSQWAEGDGCCRACPQTLTPVTVMGQIRKTRVWWRPQATPTHTNFPNCYSQRNCFQTQPGGLAQGIQANPATWVQVHILAAAL